MESIRIQGNLTPRFAKNQLTPFLGAVANLQLIVDEMRGKPPSDVVIHEISWEKSGYVQKTELRLRNQISLNEAKQVLSGLREVIEDLYKSQDSVAIQHAKAKAVQTYLNLIRETILPGNLEYRESLRFVELHDPFSETASAIELRKPISPFIIKSVVEGQDVDAFAHIIKLKLLTGEEEDD